MTLGVGRGQCEGDLVVFGLGGDIELRWRGCASRPSLKALRVFGVNDLQNAAIGIAPIIADALTMLAATDGCLDSRMSGSGSTCFGLYASQMDAEHAARKIKAQRRAWWVRATPLT